MIEERFSDFKTAEGITLPSKYVIHFTEELQDGTTNVYEWDLTADEISNNRPLDPEFSGEVTTLNHKGDELPKASVSSVVKGFCLFSQKSCSANWRP